MSRALGWILIFMVIAAGCTPDQYAKQADRVAYAAIGDGQRAVLGRPRSFSVTYQPFRASDAQARGSIRVGEKVIPVSATGSPAPTGMTFSPTRIEPRACASEAWNG